MYDILFSLWLSYASAKTDLLDASSLNIYIAPTENIISKEKKINGKAGLVFDLKSSNVLWSKNESKKLLVASLTKLMTALVIIESHDLDEVVHISKDYSDIQGSSIGIEKGDDFTVGDLIEGLLIKSGNDAAIALSEFHSGKVGFFVDEMNKKVLDLGLKNTYFDTPIGFDSKKNYSSVYDLAILTERILKNKFIKKVVSKTYGEIKSKKGRVLSFSSTNHLLGGEIKGVKTGTTPGAGECLITLIEKDGKEILFVLLGSTNRFETTKDLIDFVFNEIK